MEITASQPYKVKLKSAAGSVRTRWQIKIWSRDPYTDKRKTLAQKTYASKAAASDAIRPLVKQFEKTHGRIHEGDRMTFADLAEYAKRTIFKPAVIVQGRKIDGVKRSKPVHGQIDTLARFFGEMRIGRIGENELKLYIKWRFDLGSLRGKSDDHVPVSLTVINRDLAVMRRMMKQAFAEGWVTRDIFLGSKIIDAGAEKSRFRIVSASEEVALLANCEREHRENPYLKAIIILALDSAMRKTEILKLSWADINFDTHEIRVLGEHTKTETERTVPLSDRVERELRELPSFGKADKVFPFASFKRSWVTTRRLAGLEDVRFHDLRRTAITRMQVANIPLAIAGKIAGHARLETTARVYTAADASIVSQVRDAINRSNEERIQPISEAIN